MNEEKIALIKKEAEDLVGKLIGDFHLEVSQDEDIFRVKIETETETATLIGRHGETIRAVQKILEVILYKKLGEPANILVNVNDFREKQEERLQEKVQGLVEEVRNASRPVYLKNLSSYERRLIHQYINDNYPDLTTESIGEGRNRQLIIRVKEESEEE